jgi:hypothetical protein
MGNCEEYGRHLTEAISLGGGQAVLSVRETSAGSFTLVSNSIDMPVAGVAEFGTEVLLSDCKFLAYDGVIERISEINFLLESSISTGSPLAIYARGYGYEVVSTLLHNWRNKRLRVLPLTPANDPQNFWFADLPYVTCVEPITSSLQNWDNLHSIGSIRITQGILSIQDQKASDRAALRRSQITREGDEIGANRALVDERAGRLSSRKIEINLGRDMGDAIGITKDRIGCLIRLHMHSRGDVLVTRSFAGSSIVIPAKSDIVGQQTASSLVKEMQTRSTVVQDV